jgi:hypothetical protein
MPTYLVYLDNRGPNVNAVNLLEDQYRGDHSSKTPYVCCTASSKATCDARVAAFVNAGATAHCGVAP